MKTPRLISRAGNVRPVRTVWSVGRGAFSDFVEHRAMRFGAALAFYTALSMAPLLIIFLAVAGAVWETAAAKRAFIQQLTKLIGPEAASTVRTVLTHASGIDRSGWAALGGLAVLLFGATIVFVHLQEALNFIWGVDVKRKGQTVMKFLRKRSLSLFMVIGIGGLLTLSLGASSVLAFLGAKLEGGLPGGGILWEALDTVLSLGIFTLVFALIFRILPDADVTWRDVWIGASVTAVLFFLGKEFIALYLGRVLVGSAFGAASSFMILLIWVYYSSLILLLGAEVTQVYARYSGRAIAPSVRGARPGLDILRRTGARVVRRGFRRRAPHSEGEEAGAGPPSPIPEDCADVWKRLRGHRFVAAMAEGTLAPEAFRDFLLQDRLMLLRLSDAAGRVASHGVDPEDEKVILAGLRRGLVVESRVQARCLDLLDASAVEADAAEPGPATSAHIEHIRQWSSARPPRAAAALVARAGAYYALAQELEPPSAPNEADPFELWQETYAAEAFYPGQPLVSDIVRDTLECTMALWDEVLDEALASD